ncbi:hypothetical protein PHYPSEUDO_007734 [Phytophthora pseudosyringae]|uniref:B box-type domain-containing protein n=1 Tax=Phytophthora pseudosyringae TaxID=221518 RepID=A0A8T1WCV5_9STRA|nr:hypothetical protein PHYPSEUDO_007734 [Phytophthora pseudosyringae]
MVVNEADEAKSSASLARLRLFLSSHAPNGPGEDPEASPEHSALGAQQGDGHDNDSSSHATAPGPPGPSEWGADVGSCPEVLVDDEEDEAGQTTIPAAGAVASVTPMSQSSKEFARIKYLLQCSLPGYRVHEGVVIWDMRNPSLVAQYEQHTAGLLELESWVAVNDLGADMGDVHSYGFTSLDANQTGMKFTTGNLQLSPPLDQPAEAKKPSSTRQLVLCKIAVGRSLVIPDEEEAKGRLPPGYHSYYLHRDEEAAPGDQEDQGRHSLQAALLDRGYYHEYILNNTLQVLPQYLVRFTFSAADAHGPAVGSCALCEQHPAVVICRNCEAQICAQCDQEVHSANKLVRRHKRTPLRSKSKVLASGGARRGRRRSSTPSLAAAIAEVGVENLLNPLLSPSSTEPTDAQINEVVVKQMEEGLLTEDAQAPTCRAHRSKKVEFYCPVCQVPVCVSCKMVGDHSIGEKGSHRLLTVADAYESCLRESLRPDPLITSRKAVIENKLQFLTRVQRSVQENKAQVAGAINEQCARALRNLDDAVAMKMRVLSGEALEFERQLQQIDWVDESLEDHRTLLPAVDFLSAWSQHKQLRAEQRDFPPFAHGSNNSAEQVKADLQVAGELRVTSADQLATPHHRLSLTSGDGDPVTSEGGETSSGNQGCLADGSQVELKAAALLAQHRRPGDNDVRKRLLNMKAALPTDPNAGAFLGSRRVVSPKCQQLLDEIRHDILAQNSAKKSSAAAGSPHSRFGVPLVGLASRIADSTATLRAFSVQPTAKKTPDDELRQRRGTSAWSTLLRHEMGLGD